MNVDSEESSSESEDEDAEVRPGKKHVFLVSYDFISLHAGWFHS